MKVNILLSNNTKIENLIITKWVRRSANIYFDNKVWSRFQDNGSGRINEYRKEFLLDKLFDGYIYNKKDKQWHECLLRFIEV